MHDDHDHDYDDDDGDHHCHPHHCHLHPHTYPPRPHHPALTTTRCGNQIGAKFWEVIADEHGIDPTGALDEMPRVDG